MTILESNEPRVLIIKNDFEISATQTELAEKHGYTAQAASDLFLEKDKSNALSRVKQSHAFALKQLSGDATTEDRDTWPIQRDASLAQLEGTASDAQTQMLTNLLLEDGETLDELATRISIKGSAMDILIGMAGGLKRRTEKAIETATSADEIKTIMSAAAVNMENAITQFKQATGQ